MEVFHSQVAAFVLVLTALSCHVRCQSESSSAVAETYTIPEESAPDTFIGDISLLAELSSLEPDTAANVQYHLVRQTPDFTHHFSVDEIAGVLRTAERLDRDTTCPGEATCLVILVVMISSSDFYRHLTIGVNILDLNDNTPQFQSTSVERAIPESTGVGSSFSIPTARDPDSPKYGVGDYRLISGGSTFQLKVTNSTTSGVGLSLILRETVDRETQAEYTCIVAAIDKGDSSKSGSMTVHINIADINDHAPRFQAESYSTSVPESAPLLTTVITVTAVDPDSGVNGQIVYGLSSQTEEEAGQLFRVDANTGDVLVAGTLDYESRQSYSLIVTAADQSEQWLPAETTVTIAVEDVNDNRPVATVSGTKGNANVSVPENAKLESFLAFVMVQDPDTEANGRVDCNMASSDFTLHSDSPSAYTLHTATELDRETTPSYTLDFVCWDYGDEALTSTTQILVTVEDVNDNAPRFSQTQYAAVLTENNAIGATVTRVDAGDVDAGPNGHVTFALDSTSNLWLNVDAQSGVITAKRAFDYEQFRNLTARVTASDLGDNSRSSSVTLEIHIRDANDEPPKFTRQTYTYEVSENLNSGVVVGQLFATDRDSAPYDKFTFALRATPGIFNPFAVDQDAGVITTNAILDREFKDTYTIVAVATDANKSSMSSTATITVTVLDENDNSPRVRFPESLNDTIQISNLSPVGHTVTRIQATDPDNGRNSTLVFTIVTGNENDYFLMDADSGVVTVQRSLSHVTVETVTLEFLVSDSGMEPRSAAGILTVSINESIELPPWVLDGNGSSGGTKDNQLVSDTNLAIVIAVVVVSTVVIVILLIAIVVVRHQEKQRKRRKSMTKLLFDQRVTVNRDVEKESRDDVMYEDASHKMKAEDDSDNHFRQAKQLGASGTRSSTRSTSSTRQLQRHQHPRQKDPIILAPQNYCYAPRGMGANLTQPWDPTTSPSQVAPPDIHVRDHDALSANSDDSGRGSNEDGSSARSNAEMDQSFSRGLPTSRSSYHGYQAEAHKHGRRSSHGHQSRSHSRSSGSKQASQTAPLSDHVAAPQYQATSRSEMDGHFQPQISQTLSNSQLYLQNYSADVWPGLSSSKV